MLESDQFLGGAIDAYGFPDRLFSAIDTDGQLEFILKNLPF